MWDPFYFSSMSSMHLFMLPQNYFFHTIFFHWSILPIINLQIILAPISIFMMDGYFIHKTPLSLGTLKIFQFIKQNFLELDFPPYHKDSLISLPICYITPTRANMVKNWKNGRDDRTYFIKNIIPTRFNHCNHQWINFLLYFLSHSSMLGRRILQWNRNSQIFKGSPIFKK